MIAARDVLVGLVLGGFGCGRLAFDPGDAPLDQVSLTCPARYTAAGSGCYRYVSGTWLEAETACELDGAHLAVIDDAAEAAVLAPLPPADDYWVGLSDRIVEGTYLAVTGEPAPYLVWTPGQPDGVDDCVAHNDLDGDRDYPCTRGDDAFCEFDGRSPDPTAF